MNDRERNIINKNDLCEKSQAISNPSKEMDLEANGKYNGNALKPIDCYDPDQQQTKQEQMVTYGIEDNPPIHFGILLGLQHFLTMFGATVSMPFIICPKLCMEASDPANGYILSTIFFVSGIVTLIQSTFGVRLPIVQGGTFTFLAPTFAILAIPKFRCPDDFEVNGWGNMSFAEKTEEWQIRIREVQGAICVSSIFQVIFGYFGVFGILLDYITPMTIAPAVAMIGFSLFKDAADKASGNWGISCGTMMFMILFSQYLKNVTFPLPVYRRYGSNKGFGTVRVNLIQLFPVLLTIVVMWGLCAILTATEVLSENDPSRTDTRIDIFHDAEWFRFPYPCQWGRPTVSVAGVFGMLAGVLASAIESIGDYFACARISGAPPPPIHAINRGIGTEGVGCIIAGLCGSGNGTTSYSENIGAIGITKVGSRRVVQLAGCLMIIIGMLNKVGALFSTIPTPIVGGVLCIMFGMITAVGLSNLQFVDLNSTRNLFVIGFSLFFALVLPQWISEGNNSDLINTGNEVADQVITVLLSTSMFVAGVLGFVLDNTIPGTPEERGLIAWKNQHRQESDGTSLSRTYDIPFITPFLKRFKCTKYVPCFPTFDGFPDLISKG